MSTTPGEALRTRWLSCHVDYACRHSGACCRAGWPLPVEARAVAGIDAALAAGRLRTVDGAPAWLLESIAAPADIAGTFRQVDAGCVFHAPGSSGAGDRHCAVHAMLGHEALPATCQHFPRVCLIDAGGVRVSLSHYCPTAASLLFEHDGPVRIVDGPPAVAGLAVPEGLDVRDELPPRLNHAVLADLDGFAAWETYVVAVLAGDGAATRAEDALARVLADAQRLSTWRPERGSSLAAAVGALGEPPASSIEQERHTARLRQVDTWRAALQTAADACRLPWTWADAPADLASLDAQYVASAWDDHAAVVRRYLAAKAFGSWLAYQADSTVGLAAWLQLSLGVLRVEATRACAVADCTLNQALLHTALRQSDLLLVHYADSLAVAGSFDARGHALARPSSSPQPPEPGP